MVATFQLEEWVEKHLKQDDSESQFIFDHVDEDALVKIFNEQSQLVAREKIQRKLDKSKEHLTSTLYIFDDVTTVASFVSVTNRS